MVSKLIDIGTKVDIQRVCQAERFFQTGDEVRIYKSKVCEVFENGEMELLMPIEAGKLLLLSLGLRYEFIFYTKSGLYKSIGQVKERYKSDNQYMLRIELHTPLSKFQRRQFFRLECFMQMKYYNITREEYELADTEAILESLHDGNFSQNQKIAKVVDISGGGVRFFSTEQHEEDSYILMLIKLDSDKGENVHAIVGHIIHCERLEQSMGHETEYESRVEFILDDACVQEEIVRYIFAQERKFRKINKG